jgi:putative transposase
MSQSTVSQAAMTCLNPHAHHITVTSSQHWDWVRQRRAPRSLSAAAKKRYHWLRWHATHGGNVSLTCRHHGISRRTFYRWQQRFDQQGLAGLEDRSHRPRRCPRPTWGEAERTAVLRVRETYPRWGKAKLQRLLGREGVSLSVSMVGRILRELWRRGRLRQGPIQRKQYGRTRQRIHACRKPKDYEVAAPGDLVQIDTLDVRPLPNRIFKHLSLVDVTSRYAAAEIGTSATAATMTAHLDRMRARLPFPVRALQIDGGSEFMAEFETYCQQQGIRLFVLPPRSPKLNGCVERLQRTFGEEFYQCASTPPYVADLRADLAAFEHTYNAIRPHQALDYATPAEFLAELEALPCPVEPIT